MSGRLLATIKQRLARSHRQQTTPPAADPPQPTPDPVQYRRFLSDSPMRYEEAVAAAQAYVSKMPSAGLGWLHAKPYDPAPGSPTYFRLMYDLLNVLQAMGLPPRARVLEVGSGPGWITEILLMLGHEVDALEPSADMLAVARERCAALPQYFGVESGHRVHFHHGTLEETEFPSGRFDAVLYFDVLHHVVDERVCIEKSFRFLRDGGCIGVVESAWHPQFKELEAALMKEMEEYGTMENPFSIEYLDQLLAQAGFVSARRYVGVNGFFSQEDLQRPIAHFSAAIHGMNNVVARKPIPAGAVPACDNFNFRTEVAYSLLSGGLDPATRTAMLRVAVANCGETLLEAAETAKAPITFALRRGVPGTERFIEAHRRYPLTRDLKPGESVTMTMQFELPGEAPLQGWELDAVAERLYWLSSRSVATLPVPEMRA